MLRKVRMRGINASSEARLAVAKSEFGSIGLVSMLEDSKPHPLSPFFKREGDYRRRGFCRGNS